MQKAEAVAMLGQQELLMPARVKAALRANDRLKLYLSVVQAGADHAAHPDQEALDLSHEMAAAGVQDGWLRDLPGSASRAGHALLLPELEKLAHQLHEDIEIMARPVLLSEPDDLTLRTRVETWSTWLDQLKGERLDEAQLRDLTHGNRHDSDSLHILVMDLHKRLNHLAAALASEDIDGAHVWQLLDEDRPRVAAFMRGLNRTAKLKLDHPGLDTAATRDGERLLLQNDIGTNDAHVLVVQVEGLRVTMTYSDLHRPRFAFFQTILSELGAQWTAVEPRVTPGLNGGETYHVGTATFDSSSEMTLLHTLEGIGSRIVFLIDWNRARKRLQHFVGGDDAVAVLTQAARLEVGHMAWLKAGGEQLIYSAMQSLGERAFRIGDRLDTVLGEAGARSFLVDTLKLSTQVLLARGPLALVADEVRMLLARLVQQRTSEFDLLAEHAAYCHALAQAVRDGLSHGRDSRQDAADELAARAKVWERQADHLVMQARSQAEHQPRWTPFARLIETTDDVADALEEAAFLMSLIADHHQQGWTADVRQVLSKLAEAVFNATQDHVKALAVARSLGAGGDASDGDAFLAALWSVLRAERHCDELLRSARRLILSTLKEAPALMLANDLAVTLELASDRLLAAGYALREVAFNRAGASA